MKDVQKAARTFPDRHGGHPRVRAEDRALPRPFNGSRGASSSSSSPDSSFKLLPIFSVSSSSSTVVSSSFFRFRFLLRFDVFCFGMGMLPSRMLAARLATPPANECPTKCTAEVLYWRSCGSSSVMSSPAFLYNSGWTEATSFVTSPLDNFMVLGAWSRSPIFWVVLSLDFWPRTTRSRPSGRELSLFVRDKMVPCSNPFPPVY
mmetsp:Transcript_19328/g.48131  ORF Transcript_19328/g.48131 Transcript_19328/m.48131 type:complete len:204 (+) Transcript_19328:1327-1938(+)